LLEFKLVKRKTGAVDGIQILYRIHQNLLSTISIVVLDTISTEKSLGLAWKLSENVFVDDIHIIIATGKNGVFCKVLVNWRNVIGDPRINGLDE
jgi:hypothetical protein